MNEPLDLERELAHKLEALAALPVLLVASDFDGTLAPIVLDPAAARPVAGAVEALDALASLPRTDVAVISGRGRRQLAELGGFPPRIELVGSHGAELEREFPAGLSAAEIALRERIERELDAIASHGRGLEVERKPAGAALHFRQAPSELAQRALAAALEGPARLSGVRARRGKEVVELAAVDASKATALGALRARGGADAALFFGDDQTDEEVFAVLEERDAGVKVGEGASRARFRIADPEAVVRALRALHRLRREFQSGRASS